MDVRFISEIAIQCDLWRTNMLSKIDLKLVNHKWLLFHGLSRAINDFTLFIIVFIVERFEQFYRNQLFLESFRSIGLIHHALNCEFEVN